MTPIQKIIEENEKRFFEELAEKLEKLFPKGECKERSPALVLNAEANVLFRSSQLILIQKVVEEVEGMKNKNPNKYSDGIEMQPETSVWEDALQNVIDYLKEEIK